MDWQKALSDYSQLLEGYPNAKRFAQALRGNIEQNVPSQADFESPEAMSQWSQSAALNAPMGLAIKSYHGTPHSFDKFDMSKIGTGEGAQSYGHGLYFAEHPYTAETYYSANNPSARHAFMMLDYNNGNINKAIKSVEKDLKMYEQFKGQIMPDTIEKYQTSLDILKAKKAGKDLNLGNLYNVSLEWPDAAREAVEPLSPEHFLDWDKPLNQQSQFIQNKLSKFDPEMYHNEGNDYDPEELGQMIYSRISQYPEKASQQLYQTGIPGIRYLDQGSRGAGKGTSNYVVFSDQIPRIVEKLRGNQ